MNKKHLQYIEIGEFDEIPDYVEFNLILAEPFIEQGREVKHKLRMWYSVETREKDE